MAPTKHGFLHIFYKTKVCASSASTMSASTTSASTMSAITMSASTTSASTTSAGAAKTVEPPSKVIVDGILWDVYYDGKEMVSIGCTTKDGDVTVSFEEGGRKILGDVEYDERWYGGTPPTKRQILKAIAAITAIEGTVG